MAIALPELLRKVVELEGSDLHITTDTPPQIRVHGHLSRVDGLPLTASETKQLTYSVLTDLQKKRFEETMELDFSFGIKGLARFRCNMFNQRGAVGAVYRLIPEKVRRRQFWQDAVQPIFEAATQVSISMMARMSPQPRLLRCLATSGCTWGTVSSRPRVDFR